MKQRFIALAIIALLVMMLSGCAPQLESIDVIDREISMNKGDTLLIEVSKTYTAQEATVDQAVAAIEKADFTWSSSNETVVTVGSGKITAVNAGSATITVTAQCGKTPASIDIAVTVIVPAIDLQNVPDTLDLTINTDEDHVQLEPIVLPSDTTDLELSYHSEDETVATVDDTGLVTAVSNGDTEIVVFCGAVEKRIAVSVTTYVAPKANTSSGRNYSSSSSSGGSSSGSGSSTPASTPSPDPAPSTPPNPSSGSGEGYFIEPGGISPDDGGF